MRIQLLKDVVVLGVAVAFVAACDTEPTEESTPQEDLGEQRVHPDVAVHSPDQGTFAADGEITIEGGITVGSAPIERVLVNGEPASFGDDYFEKTVSLDPGPNIFGVRAEAEDRGRAVDAITVYGPSLHEPTDSIDHALHVRLGQPVIDNNTAELDDIAGVSEALLENDEFLEWMFSEPFDAGDMGTVEVTRITTSNANVDLQATSWCLETAIELGGGGGGVEADLYAEGAVSLLGDEIQMYADRILVETDICTASEADGVELETYDTQVVIDGFLLSTNEYPDLSEDYPDTVESLSDTAEEALEDWLAGSMADLVNDFLEDFVSSYTFEDPMEVTASLGVRDLTIDNEGLTLDLHAQFSAPKGLLYDPSNPGSANAEIDPLEPDFSDAPMAVAMSTDALNQLVFALWYGGSMDQEADPEMEGLGELPEVFQPLTALDAQVWLPPGFVEPTHPEDYMFDFAVGGIDIDLEAEDDYFDMGLEFQAGVGIEVDKEGQIDLQLDNRAQYINVEAAVDTAPEKLDRGDVAALVRMIVPSVLGEVDVVFEGFTIPSIDVGALGDSLSEFEGREVTFIPQDFRTAGDTGMYLVVDGDVQEAQ